ncbi:MAG: threonine--tRNA ligase [Marinilabiliales bacterium]|nr:MAG: threonine--tRNA ligase [Marinilabiliales bacterium]
MIKITLPDGSVREYESGVNGFDIANSISPRLAKEVLSISVNGDVWDLSRPIEQDSNIVLHKFENEEGKHAFWHTSAHILAEAIESIFPGTKFGIGPTIENGFYYDIELPEGRSLSEKDFPSINKKMLELCQQNNEVTRKDISKADAIKYFKEKGDEYKLELISELEEGTITLYSQGNFTDLCKGPHLTSTGKIKAIQILSLAGAYWRGDETRQQLTRVYGISFPKQKMLTEYLEMLEEAKKRDHRKLGKELELFHFSHKVGMGMALWLPKGTELRDRLESWLTSELKKRDHEMVKTPHIGHIDLYKTSGHYEKYGKDSFQPIQTPAEGEAFMLKPMNCPHHVEIYKARQFSYRDLPYRMAEFGTVYRYEQHGELHGLTRVRSFTQDDAHVFCRPDQVKDEFKSIIELIMYVYKSLGFNDYKAQISLRDPEDHTKYIGTDENWDKAEKAIQEAAHEMGLEPTVELGEAAFYGPKLDFIVKDAIGRSWQLGTIQVDYNLPERFELEYTGSYNLKHQPIMLHRAIFGSMERFVAVLIEHTGGKFPLLLTPEQVVLLPVSEKYNDFAEKVLELLKNYDIRGKVDDRNEKVGRKIRDNELQRIPYLIVLGEKEAEAGNLSVRKQGKGDLGSMTIEEFAELMNKEIEEYFNN